MNREELVYVIRGQWILVIVLGVVSFLFGRTVALSSTIGGVCVAVPNTVLGGILVYCETKKSALSPVVLLLGEVIKLLATCLLLVLAAVCVPTLNWPAFVMSVGIAALGGLLVLFIKH